MTFSLIPISLLLFAVFGAIHCLVPSEQAAIISIMHNVQRLPPFWNESNVEHACDWIGIECDDSHEHVTRLYSSKYSFSEFFFRVAIFGPSLAEEKLGPSSSTSLK